MEQPGVVKTEHVKPPTGPTYYLDLNHCSLDDKDEELPS